MFGIPRRSRAILRLRSVMPMASSPAHTKVDGVKWVNGYTIATQHGTVVVPVYSGRRGETVCRDRVAVPEGALLWDSLLRREVGPDQTEPLGVAHTRGEVVLEAPDDQSAPST
jgi:hypothetical protein